jgi:alpha-beta hydrolase superfamily lysophospholipase
MINNNRYKIYRPVGEVKGCVQILHGMAEYKERYEYFINKLTESGFACIIHDHRGHGLSCKDEELGFFASAIGWQKLIDDTNEVMAIMKKEYPNKPYALFAHSMGTILARTFIQKYANQIDYLILSGAPNYSSAVPAGMYLSRFIAKIKGERYKSKLLENMFTGAFNKGFDKPNQWLSYNQDNVDKYNADNRCGFPFTARGYEDMAYGLNKVHFVDKYIVCDKNMPILFFAGKDDPCIGGEAGIDSSIQTISEAGYVDIEKKLFDGDRHETLNEDNKDEICQFVINWLDKKMS